MRIEEIHIDGYGALSGLQLPLEGGLVCVYGDNEAGKSTLLSFIRCVFFGFKSALTEHAAGADRRTAPYDPVAGGTKGGHVVVSVYEEGEQMHYRLERKKVRKEDGDLVVEDMTRGRRFEGEEAHRVADRLLGGTKEAVFSHLFAVGPDELHALKSLERDEVRSVLFTAEAGVGPGFVHTLKRLREEEEKLHRPGRARKPEINALQSEQNDLKRQIRQAQQELSGFEKERDAANRAKEEEETLEKKRDGLQAAVRRAELRMKARTILSRMNKLQEEIKPLQERRLPDGETMSRVERALERLETIREAQTGLDEEIRSLQEEQRSVRFKPEDAAAWRTLSELSKSGLAQDLETYTRHEELLAKLERIKEPHIAQEQREEIRRLLREQDRLHRSLEEVQHELVAHREAMERTRDQILPSDVHQTARAVERLDLGERAREVERAKQSVMDQTQRYNAKARSLGPDWSDEKVAQVPTDRTTVANVQAELVPQGTHTATASPSSASGLLLAAGLGLVGIAVVLLLTTLLSPMFTGVLVAGGLVLALIGGLQRTRKTASLQTIRSVSPQVKKVLSTYGLVESVAREDFRELVDALAEVKRERESLGQTRRRFKQAKSRFDEAVDQVQSAADQITEALGKPLEADSRDPYALAVWVSRHVQDSEHANAALRADEKQLKSEQVRRDKWQKEQQGVLKRLQHIMDTLGVPGPEPLVEAIDKNESRDSLESELRGVEGTAKRFQAFEEQIAQVQRSRGQQPPGREGFVAAVQAIYDECRKAHDAEKYHQDLTKRLKEKTRERDNHRATRESKESELKEIWADHGVGDQEGLLEQRADGRRLSELQQDLKGEEGKLTLLESNAPGLRDEAMRVTPDEDQALLAGADDKKLELENRLRENREEQKALHAKLNRAVSQDTLGALHSRLSAVEAELQDARERWVELALTRFLLERARSEYEERHGPRVLNRAGEFLAQVTKGRYTKILPSLESDGYVLVRENGKRVPAVPPSVSRGMFAQVYLLVRLAFTDVMARDSPLPYVLDDVLVDFDEGRLQRTVQLLAQIASNRQVIVFTHHSHVADAVRDCGGSVVPVAKVNGEDQEVTIRRSR